jgi:hypothetical protein
LMQCSPKITHRVDFTISTTHPNEGILSTVIRTDLSVISDWNIGWICMDNSLANPISPFSSLCFLIGKEWIGYLYVPSSGILVISIYPTLCWHIVFPRQFACNTFYGACNPVLSSPCLLVFRNGTSNGQ